MKRGRKKGCKISEEHKKKLSKAKMGKLNPAFGKPNWNSGLFLGERSPQWKGDNAGVHSKHTWIVVHYGKAYRCEHCGTKTAKKYEWSNKDHKYKRDREYWQMLCSKCHLKYDTKYNNYIMPSDINPPKILYKGKLYRKIELSKKYGIEYKLLKSRLYNGWSVDRAIKQKKQIRNYN